MESGFIFGVGFRLANCFRGGFFYLEAGFIWTLKLEADIRGIYLFRGILLMSIKNVGEFHKPRKPCHQLAQCRYSKKCAGVLQFFISTGTPAGLRVARGHFASVSDGPVQ